MEYNKYDYYPDEEPSYGLCNQCANNDGCGKCSKYKMPLYMVQRKKKCKHFHLQGTCFKCKIPFEQFCDWDDKTKDTWEYVVCFKCGLPFKFGSANHRNHILSKIIQWRYPLSQDRGFSRERHFKEYLEQLRQYQEFYLSALYGEKNNG